MKKYTIRLIGSVDINVIAKNEDEAVEKAFYTVETQDYGIHDILEDSEIIKEEEYNG